MVLVAQKRPLQKLQRCDYERIIKAMSSAEEEEIRHGTFLIVKGIPCSPDPEEDKEEVETHSYLRRRFEQYTIISSHHLQQPVRKSNPRKWNPKASDAVAASSSGLLFFCPPRNGIYATWRKLLYEQWDEFNSVLFAIIIIVVDIFFCIFLQMLWFHLFNGKLYFISRKVVNFIFR